MTTPNIGILGDGDIERAVSEYYLKKRLAMCSLNPREADRDWEHFFDANDGMIIDFLPEDRLLVTSILTATRDWQSRVVVLAEDYQNCWAELKAIGAQPLMVIPRPSDGSTEFHGYCIDLYRAANEIATAMPPADDNIQPVPNDDRKRSVTPLLQLTGGLLLIGGVVTLVSMLFSQGEDISGNVLTILVGLISTGVTMLGGPKLPGFGGGGKPKP